MMNYVRATTVDAVAGLTVEQLDFVHDEQSNSIGALLAHIGAAEAGYQAATFHGRDLNEDEKRRFGAALDLGGRGSREIHGHELGHYLDMLETVRAHTLTELGSRDDAWLDEETTFGNGQRVNNYFKWFHVFGHEINHRGQIRWLRRRATGR
jgi:uncharacterized damage-inducible protein DinB